MRRHLTYANVAATLALVFSITGGALAAKHYLINSASQINPKVLRELRGRNGGQGSQGPAGPQGPAGANGATGASGEKGQPGTSGSDGATHVVVRYGQGGAGVGGLGIAQAKCEPGERATGGGGTEVVSGSHEKVVFYTPGGAPLPPSPGATPTGWSVEWLNTGATEDVVSVYVICASP